MQYLRIKAISLVPIVISYNIDTTTKEVKHRAGFIRVVITNFFMLRNVLIWSARFLDWSEERNKILQHNARNIQYSFDICRQKLVLSKMQCSTRV